MSKVFYLSDYQDALSQLKNGKETNVSFSSLNDVEQFASLIKQEGNLLSNELNDTEAIRFTIANETLTPLAGVVSNSVKQNITVESILNNNINHGYVVFQDYNQACFFASAALKLMEGDRYKFADSKENTQNEVPEVNSSAERLLQTILNIWLVLGWIVSIGAFIIPTVAADGEGSGVLIGILIAPFFLLVFHIVWALAKVQLNISCNLFNINENIKKLISK